MNAVRPHGNGADKEERQNDRQDECHARFPSQQWFSSLLLRLSQIVFLTFIKLSLLLLTTFTLKYWGLTNKALKRRSQFYDARP